MEFETYDVYAGDKCVARDMTLDDAIILIKGLFYTYYNETNLEITLKRSFHSITNEEVVDWK